APEPSPDDIPDLASPTKIASDRKKAAAVQTEPEEDAIEVLPEPLETAEMAAHPGQETVKTERPRKAKGRKKAEPRPLTLARDYPIAVAGGIGAGLALLCGLLWFAFSGPRQTAQTAPAQET